MVNTEHPGVEKQNPRADTQPPMDRTHPGDFFTRLAERALGAAPLAQPVIAPAFAPHPAAAGTADSPGAEWAGLARVAADPDLSPAAAAFPPAGQLPRRGSLPGTWILSAAARTQFEDVSSQRGQAGLLPDQQPGTLEPPTLPALMALPTSVSAETFILEADSQRDNHNSPPVQPVSADQMREPPYLLVPRLPPGGWSAAQSDPSGGAQARRSDQAAAAAPAPISTRRGTSLAVQPARAEAEAGGQPPTIRITIGRVEVRAVQPAPIAPAHPTLRPAPALTLDDYLKRRNEARR
jgi:hypothetical protein